MISEVLAEAEVKMTKAVEATREDFASVRTGRANPAMFNKVTVDYYGTPTPLSQLGSIQNPEARSIVISPYDKSVLGAIERALRDMPNLGANQPAGRRRGTPQGACEAQPRQSRKRTNLGT